MSTELSLPDKALIKPPATKSEIIHAMALLEKQAIEKEIEDQIKALDKTHSIIQKWVTGTFNHEATFDLGYIIDSETIDVNLTIKIGDMPKEIANAVKEARRLNKESRSTFMPHINDIRANVKKRFEEARAKALLDSPEFVKAAKSAMLKIGSIDD